MNKEKLAGMIREMINIFYQQDSLKDAQKDIAQRAEDEFGKEVMSKAKFNKIARHAYKLDAAEKAAELEEIIDLIEELGV